MLMEWVMENQVQGQANAVTNFFSPGITALLCPPTFILSAYVCYCKCCWEVHVSYIAYSKL